MTNISWTGRTWLTQTGCDKISAGCKFCYAELISLNHQAKGTERYKNGFKLNLLGEKEIEAPLRWTERKTMVFLNSMSDTFHPEVPIWHIRKTFDVMEKTPWFTYQVLTKRPERAAEMSNQLPWPNNIWMGTSIEDKLVLHRLDALKKTGARTKFLSLEPLIGALPNLNLDGIDWVIVGGESGTSPREIKKEWVEDIQKQCAQSGTAFFFKQWGHRMHNPDWNDPTQWSNHSNYEKGGCRLNGEIFQEWPDAPEPPLPKKTRAIPLF
ncbi:DUF5131 family protein [Bacteroidota bacterium]